MLQLATPLVEPLAWSLTTERPGASSTPATIVRRDTYDGVTAGSSSTEGGQQTPGVSAASLLTSGIPGTKTIFNVGQGGTNFLASQTGTANVETKLLAMTADQKAGWGIVQCDTNVWTNTANYHIDKIHFDNLATHIVNRFDAPSRVALWVGTEYNWQATPNARNKRFQRNAWAAYPGQAINEWEYWQLATSDPTFTSVTAPFTGATDDTAKSSGQIPVSYQLADRSHPNDKGQARFVSAWRKDWVEALETGGCPFFALYPYYTTLSTAQTNGGHVVELNYVGDLTGTTISVKTLAGAPHPHFTVNVIGSAAWLDRASATLLTDQRYEFVLQVTRQGNTKNYVQYVSIGALDAVPRRTLLDSHFFGITEGNDFSGSPSASAYPSATSRIWEGLGAGPFTEWSFVCDYEPTRDGGTNSPGIFYHTNGIQMTHLVSNGFDMGLRDTAGASLGGLTGTGCTVANGRQLWFCSASVSVPYKEIVADVGVTAARATFTNTNVNGLTNINVNPLISQGPQFLFSRNTNGSSVNGNAFPTAAGTNNCHDGKQGFIWAAPFAIDWTVEANRLLFRNSLSDLLDLSVARPGTHPGDGRSIIVQAGGRGLNVGATITPYLYMRGGPGDWGRNFGTGGDLYMFNRKDPTGAVPGQGIPVLA